MSRITSTRAVRPPALDREVESFLSAPSPAMADLRQRFLKVAPTSVPVLVTGESGTGKEVLARAIHAHSKRSREPFVAVNCAALPRELIETELFGHERGAFTGATSRRIGKFEAAGAGTLLLDEVGELPLDVQAKLLRAVQERVFEPIGTNRQVRFEARLITATSRNLREAIQLANFRLDLYYRIAVVTLSTVPLRRRTEDLPSIAHSLLTRHAEREGVPVKRVASAVIQQLASYPWPGNIRELDNVLIAAAITSDEDTIARIELPAVPLRAPDLGTTGGPLFRLPTRADDIRTLAEYEQILLEAALQAADGNVSDAARRLGIGRATLRRKLTKGEGS